MRWVISALLGVVVGLVAGLVVWAVASWASLLPSAHFWVTIIAGLVAGVSGACAQAYRARDSVLEQLLKKLPPEFVFPTLIVLVGVSTILTVSKSDGTYEEKRLYIIAVVVILGFCFMGSVIFSLVKRGIAAKEKMFEAATRAIKDNPEFKENIKKMCFDVVDSL